jgi:hypothetical protein
MLAYWSPVTHPRAESRGRGDAVPHWTQQNGELKHYPGHANDYLYFNVPLRGNFEVNCELTSFGWREARLAYGTLRYGIVHDLKSYNLARLNRDIRTGQINPPLKDIPYDGWYAYRLAVRDGNYVVYVNGRKLYEERLPAEPDPWLTLHLPAQNTGGLRKLTITGNPTVPDTLSLSHLPDLTGWMADYYGESTAAEQPIRLGRPDGQPNNAAWEKRGEEIVGRIYTEIPGSKQESVLQYHRPLLEDGVIEYEFYYDPGKALTHPALDRLTFLLDPDGVKVHWLTDAQYERTGLTPDNATAEPANRKGPDKLPLKERTWNRVKLSLAGNKVTLQLNDTEVYQRELEPTNQRIFGLFHYADETEVRVRNVKYSGQWPKKLPSAEGLFAPLASRDK